MPRADVAAAAAGFGCLLGIVGVVAAADQSTFAAGSPLGAPGSWQTVLDVGLVVAVVAYAIGVWLTWRWPPRLVTVSVLAVAIQVTALAGPLLLSTDADSYATWGRAARPYHEQDGWGEPTSYGTLWTIVSAPIAHFHDPERGYRVLACLCALAVTAGAAFLARNRAAAVAFVGWNPLIALHAAGGGHNDFLLMVVVIGALILERFGRLGAAQIAWAAAIWIKWIPLLFYLPWLIQRYRTGKPLKLAWFVGANVALLALSFGRFGLDWLNAFSNGARAERAPSSLGIGAWLPDIGFNHRETVAFGFSMLLVVAIAAMYLAWRRRARLGLTASFVALSFLRFDPWYLSWGIGLSGADEDPLGRILAVVMTAVLLTDVLPR